MKKTGIINSEVSAVVANMGHMDWLSIGDAGMPVPFGTKKIDLAVDKELPSFMDVLNNVLKEMKVQKIYLAEEIKDQNPEQLENIKKAQDKAAIVVLFDVGRGLGHADAGPVFCDPEHCPPPKKIA